MTTKFLTAREVAQRLRVTEATVGDWLRSGRLRGYRPGGAKLGWRIAEEDLNAFLESVVNVPDAPPGRRGSQPDSQLASAEGADDT